MPSPRISFYMTVKNGRPYLRQAVESIRAQDIDDWEAIIVDDGSTDESPAYLHSLSIEEPRFRVQLTTGIGRGKALNLAVSCCRAPILSNLDADDLAHPSRATLLLELFHRNPRYSVITGDRYIVLDDARPHWAPAPIELDPIRDINHLLPYTNPVKHSSVGIRRNALLAVGGYDECRISQFDYDLWVRLAAAGQRVGASRAVLGAKRSHSKQAFERSGHLRYAVRSAQVRWSAIKTLGGSRLFGVGSIGFHLAWACLPASVRMRARRLRQKSPQ